MKKLVRYLLRRSFIRFSLVGVCGYTVDASFLAFDTDVLGMNFAAGRALSIFVAMCCTWAGNRYLTFAQHRARTLKGAWHEWLKFVGANLIGATVNYMTSVLLVRYAPEPFSHKYVAQFAGVAAGLMFNFTLSKKLVFKAPPV